MVFDSLSIGTTLPIESVVSKKRAELAFWMPLAERLNDAQHASDRRAAAKCRIAGCGLRRRDDIDKLRTHVLLGGAHEKGL